MVSPRSQSEVSEKTASLTVKLVDGDANELNNTWDAATELTRNVNTYFNLCGSNDIDWFKLTTTVPGEAVKIIFSNYCGMITHHPT